MGFKQRHGRTNGHAYRQHVAKWEAKEDAARIPRPAKRAQRRDAREAETRRNDAED